MKMREIILDFTSLLDVIMIILFWFILNYQSETAKIRRGAEEAQANAEAAASQAVQMQEQAQRELDLLDEMSHNQASVLSEVFAFGSGGSLNLSLHSEARRWELTVTRGTDTYLGTIDDRDADRVGLILQEMLAEEGYAADDMVFCVFAFDSDEAGSNQAYRTVTEQLRTIQKVNSRFFYTELDRAVPEEAAT